MAINTEYGVVLCIRLVGVRLSVVILGASRRIAPQLSDAEKVSAYECGFEPYGDARNRFDIRFYLVAIRFIVFDLEASFMFPWARTLGEQGYIGYWTIVEFVVELLVGYLYAWKLGALEWE